MEPENGIRRLSDAPSPGKGLQGMWTSSITFPQKVHRYITTDCFASNCNPPSQICCVMVTTVSVDIGLVADGATGL